MSEHDRKRWENRHDPRRPSGPRPTIEWVPASRNTTLALDVACGQGRHCPPLLRAGYRVVAVDVSRAALAHLREMTANDRRIMALQADLDHWPFAPEVFDLVVMIDFLDRRLFASLLTSVKTEGHVLIDTFVDNPDPLAWQPKNPDYVLKSGELDEVFAGWEILERRLFDGFARRDAILARRPSRWRM